MVLVVDDQKLIRLLVRVTLRDRDVIEATSGEQALSILRDKAQDVELVVLDLMMPGIGGIAVLRAIREDESLRGLPVVVLTADDDASEELMRSGLCTEGCLRKPFSPASLSDTVECLLDGSSSSVTSCS